jgi:hypothetical protein
MKIRRPYLRAYIESQLEASKRDGLFHTLRRYFLSRAIYPYLFGARLYPVLRITAPETCSLPGRIGHGHIELNYFPVIRSYWKSSPTQRLFWNTYNQARSACIREMAANHPWAT